MDACQSGNILESLVMAASLCDLLLSFMSGLKLEKSKPLTPNWNNSCFIVTCFVQKVEQSLVGCGCSSLSHSVPWAHGSSQPGLGPALCHFTTAPALGTLWALTPRHPFRLTVLFFLHPKANRQKDQRNNSQPQSSSLCPHSALPCPSAHQSRRTAGPATGGTSRARGCAELEPQAAWHPLLPASSCLPHCLQGRSSHGAPGRVPQGCITHHPAGASCLLWAWCWDWLPCAGKGAAHLH